MAPIVLIVLALALGAAPGLASAAAPARLSFDQVFATDAAGRLPAEYKWEPGGGRLSYVWDEAGDGSGKALWELEAATGKSKVLLRFSDLKAADLKGKGADPKADFAVDDYAWSPRGDALLLVSAGDLYLYRPADANLRRLTSTPEAEENPRFSPDGAHLAFVRRWNLYVLDLDSGAERALTTDGAENAILNGINDWVYEEEIWDRFPEAYWWSPDSRRIAFLHFDEAKVGVYPIVDSSPLYPTVTWQKYPKAGEPNPHVKIGVVEVASGATSWLATGDPESYLARLAWTPKGEAVAVERLNREQTQLDLLRCMPIPSAASGICAPILTETWKTWINLASDFRYLPDGRFVWGSEREGWRRLYLYDAAGKLIRPLTPQGWQITAVDALGADGKEMVVTGFEGRGLEPTHRRVARVGIEREGWEVLTPGRGSHRAVADPKTLAWVHLWSSADTLPQGEVRPPAGATGGGAPIPLPHAASKLDVATLPQWEFLDLPGPDGLRLPGRLLKPAGFDPSRRYPVIIYHYGGPGSQVVDDAWSVRVLWQKAMAQRGFAVFSVDNASSLFFGKAGEDRDYRRFGEVNLAGQLAGVAYLQTLPWVDGGRLGLWGWSGGGANTLYCILNRPGVWHAAVSGAPVTDWKLYDTIWTERYLDRPQDNADGYRDSSPLTYAAKLADHLLLVHGLADDNVHTQNSVVMSDAFIKANRPFEQAFYPGQKHGFRPGPSRHFYEKMSEFFERQLQGVEVEDVKVEEKR
jgi:dipeptidyl-peptidase-4